MLERGKVVVSLAGKDKGREMVILSANESGAYVADGRLRRLEGPKYKNNRHMKPTDVVLDEAAMATNRELRRALKTACAGLWPDVS